MSSKKQRNNEKPMLYNPYSFMNRLCTEKIPLRSEYYQPKTFKDVKRLEFSLVSEDTFSISGCSNEKMAVFLNKKLNGVFNYQEKTWTFPISSYDSVLLSLKNAFSDYHFSEIPSFVFESLKKISTILQIEASFAVVFPESSHKSIEHLPHKISKNIREYQLKNVQFALNNHARIIIGDELGLGKSLQALSIAYLFQETWPLLIISPSFLQFFWYNELLYWLESLIKPSEIHVILNEIPTTSSENARIFLVSDTFAQQFLSKTPRNFGFVICDELFSGKKQRVHALMPILQRINHILLVETSLFSKKPQEIFELLRILRPFVFTNFNDFAERYCDPKPCAMNLGVDFTGIRNIRELELIIKKNYGVCTRKTQVKSQLLEKNRKKVFFCGQQMEIQKNFEDFLRKHQENTREFQRKWLESEEICKEIGEMQKENAKYKIKSTKEYVKYLVKCQEKALIYFNLSESMEEIASFLNEINVSFVKLDEKMSSSSLKTAINIFQENLLYKFALISYEVLPKIQNFANVSHVLFAELATNEELQWSSESKLVGFADNTTVNFHYLLTQSGVDPIIFENFMEKFEKNNFFEDKKQTSGENQQNNVGIIKNLDKIEELIKEWEREKLQKIQTKKLNREEFLIESESSLKLLEKDDDFSMFKKKKKRKKTLERSKEIITIIE